MVGEYDNSVGESKLKIDKIEKENFDLMNQIEELEDKCRKMKFEKKTNKIQMDVWN